MAANWTRLPEGSQEECASVRCGHAPAAWRLDTGGIGSYYCETCRSKIVGSLAEMEPCGCPTPGACSAVERIAELEAALRELLDTFNPEPRMDDVGLIWGRAALALKGNK